MRFTFLLRSLKLRLGLRARCAAATGLVLATFLIPAPSIAADPVVRVSRRPITAWTNNHCGSCHTVDALFSHPTDRVPSMGVPDGLPLHGGKITCVTCHDDSVDAHRTARADGAALLRNGLNAAELCQKCHDRRQATRPDQHGTSLNRAHLRWPSRKEIASEDRGIQLDADTRTCLSCHDGLMSADIAMGTGRSTEVAREHPIGVNMAVRASDPELALRHPDLLDGRIRLAEGRVGCTSCHSPFSGKKRLLVMSNQRSQLCLSCHIQ
jgi:predicted CXXCH cytochrome family protein